MRGTMTTSIRDRSLREWARRLLLGVVLFGVQFGFLYLVTTYYFYTDAFVAAFPYPVSDEPIVTDYITLVGTTWVLAIYNIVRLIWRPRPAMIVAAALQAVLVTAYVVQWNPAGIMICVIGGLILIVPVVVEWLIRRRRSVTIASLIMIAMSTVGVGACGEREDRTVRNKRDGDLEIDWAEWQRSCIERLSIQRSMKDPRYRSIHMHERNVERLDLQRFDTLTTLLSRCRSSSMDEADVVILYVCIAGNSPTVAALLADSAVFCVAGRKTEGLEYVSDDRYRNGTAEEAIERLWMYPQGSVGETDYDVIMMSRVIDDHTETRLWYLSDPIVGELAMEVGGSSFF